SGGLLARYNSDGTLDASFGGGGYVTANSIGGRNFAIQPDGKLLIAGSTGADFAVERLNGDGSLDNTFGSNGIQTIDFGQGNDRASFVAVVSDGKVVVGGST